MWRGLESGMDPFKRRSPSEGISAEETIVFHAKLEVATARGMELATELFVCNARRRWPTRGRPAAMATAGVKNTKMPWC